MATTKKLTATITANKQGWYNSSKKSGTSKVMSITFPAFTDAKNYTISDAKLYMTFNTAGGGYVKKFKMTFVGKNSFTKTVSSAGKAYNQKTYVSLNSYISQLSSWLAGGGTVIQSVDPEDDEGRTASSGGYYSQNYCQITGAYLQLTVTLNASSASFESTTMEIGSEYSVTVEATDETYLHDLFLVTDDTNLTLLNDVGVGDNSFLVPFSIGTTFPNATSRIVTMVLNTKSNGEVIGTKSYSITLTATSEECYPTAATVIDSNENIILGGITKVSVVSTAFGKYGATIQSYEFFIDDLLCDSNTTGTFSFLPENISKTLAIKVIATDSRSYSTENVLSLYVNSYDFPSFSNVSFYRCDALGNKDEINGIYAKINYDVNVYSLKDKEGVEVSNESVVSMTLNGETYSSNIENTIYGTFLTDTSYAATLKVEDSMGHSSVTTMQIPSANYLLHFRKSQKSIGIGCAADDIGETEKRIKVAWPLVLDDTISLLSPLEIPSGGTGAGTAAGACINLGAVRTSGDIMTGTLTLLDSLSIEGSSKEISLKNNSSLCFYDVENNKIASFIHNNNNFILKQSSSGFTESYLLPTIDTELDEDKTYNILTSKDFYQDEVTIKPAYAWGWITSDGKAINLCFPLSYRVPHDKTITVTSLLGNMRGSSKYFLPSGDGAYTSGGYEFLSTIDATTYVPQQSILRLHLSFSTGSSINNSVLQFDGTLSFTLT